MASENSPVAAFIEMWKQADCVCFDVDSTVLSEEGIDVLAAECGHGEGWHFAMLLVSALICLQVSLMISWALNSILMRSCGSYDQKRDGWKGAV